ncbi:zinc ribbon domain-containing protein [Proteiniborus sp. MB09-C3]|uniref:zinc ribbon domain-containing protein n=1 Tax=Proteiniborus sp. MB09-C3 TaxID=3050072 RepID=UPI0025532B6F|nr:zinc ribbon domain-containing protein [Proteiniborus sp. MB09-C3]WIV11034.1 zinc ribbon domain-containing protein [Proteiniborus sp. MB09-C3]
MFFIGIFGIETKEKIIKELPNFYCKNCNKEEAGQLIKKYNYFHFFFLPIIKWNEIYYILCNNCNTIYETAKEKGKRIELGEDENVTYWDLQEIKKYKGIRICKSCNNEVDDEFLYCPYCGEKLE